MIILFLYTHLQKTIEMCLNKNNKLIERWISWFFASLKAAANCFNISRVTCLKPSVVPCVFGYLVLTDERLTCRTNTSLQSYRSSFLFWKSKVLQRA